MLLLKVLNIVSAAACGLAVISVFIARIKKDSPASRQLWIIAGVGLVVGLLIGVYETPLRERAFRSEFGGLIAKLLPSADFKQEQIIESPELAPRFLVCDSDGKDFRLPLEPEMKASSRDEVGTVVIVNLTEEEHGLYDNGRTAYKAVLRVCVFDPKDGRLIGRQIFTELPPAVMETGRFADPASGSYSGNLRAARDLALWLKKVVKS